MAGDINSLNLLVKYLLCLLIYTAMAPLVGGDAQILTTLYM